MSSSFADDTVRTKPVCKIRKCYACGLDFLTLEDEKVTCSQNCYKLLKERERSFKEEPNKNNT